MLKLNKHVTNLGRLLLYGVVFSSLSYLSTLIFGDRLSYHPPIAEADVPYAADPGYSTGDSGGSCDGGCGGCGCDCSP
jgi:hypothetical protein